MKRWSIGLDNRGNEELQEDPEGPLVYFSDIPLQTVPEPLPWLDQPDGEGDWRYWPSGWEKYKLVQLETIDIGNGPELSERFGSRLEVIQRLRVGRWQKIPQPSLPNNLNPPKCQQCKLVIEPWQSIEDHSHGSGDIHDA